MNDSEDIFHHLQYTTQELCYMHYEFWSWNIPSESSNVRKSYMKLYIIPSCGYSTRRTIWFISRFDKFISATIYCDVRIYLFVINHTANLARMFPHRVCVVVEPCISMTVYPLFVQFILVQSVFVQPVFVQSISSNPNLT